MIKEVDHNHPDHPSKQKVELPAVELNQVEIGDDSVLYIRIADFQGGPERAKRYSEIVKEQFKELLPDTKIIVGTEDLRFSTITKKRVFKGKLDGKL